MGIRKAFRILSFITCIIFAGGCTPPVVESALEPQMRNLLTYDDLMSGFDFKEPLNESAFAMPEDAAFTQVVFEGRLELLGESQNGEIQVLRGDASRLASVRHLPEFDFEFVQNGNFLVPVQRGLIITADPQWNYILEPGMIWFEEADRGFARASFPFALVPKGDNAIFNGVMSFLFNGETVSRVCYQITQETTTNTQADFWGLLEAQYHPGTTVDAEQVRSAHDSERAAFLPTKPIEQLAQDYPGFDLAALAQDVSPENMTWYGFWVNGVNYVSDCTTRYGEYAYCASMRAASYSTAKSMFASVVLMRLAQKYGQETADLLVKDYVSEISSAVGNWEKVTFDHVLDMATGNYRSPVNMVDENSNEMYNFYIAQPYAKRMQAALIFPNAVEPGIQWVYHTSDTFIGLRAMQNFLQSKEGPQADIFRFVVDEVYRPIGVGQGAFSSMRTADNNWQGQAEGGYGLWWTQDDIARIASLLLNEGKHDGEQILHPALLAAALQQDAQDRGMRIGDGYMYNNAFWAQRYGSADGYDCEFWVMQMQGVSGNVVALMPNGTAYYYFSDSKTFSWDAAVMQSDKIITYCQPGK